MPSVRARRPAAKAIDFTGLRAEPSLQFTLVTSGFALRDGAWTCDGVPLADIARAAGTPCYVYSAAAVRERAPPLDARPCGLPARHPLRAQGQLDARPGPARARAGRQRRRQLGRRDRGRPAGRLPARPDRLHRRRQERRRDRRARWRSRLKAINAESRGELERIDAESIRQGRRTRVALRVNPDVDARSHPHISTGLKRNKFGVPIGDARALLGEMAARPGLEVVGVHVHVGSQMTTLEPLDARRGADGRAGRGAEGRRRRARAPRSRRRPRHQLRRRARARRRRLCRRRSTAAARAPASR